jgi:hypothetical protein
MLIEVTKLVEVDVTALRNYVASSTHPNAQAPLLGLLDSLEAGDWEALAEKCVEHRWLLSYFPRNVRDIADALIERKRLEKNGATLEPSYLKTQGGALAVNYPKLQCIDTPEKATT